MRFSRVWDSSGRAEEAPRPPRVINGGQIDPLADWSHGDGVREVRHYGVRAGGQGRDMLSGSLLWLAGLIIAGSLLGAGFVAYESQRLFALANNHGDGLRAAITGALPDAGWGAMAIVALVAALRGRSSARARLGVVIFFALSLGAQLMYAPRTWSGYLVAVIPPIVLAWMLESFVVEVRRWAGTRRGLDLDETPVLTTLARVLWAGPRLGGRFALWLVRLGMDRAGTWEGIRGWVLDEAPLAPGRTAASLRAAAAVEAAGSAEQNAHRERAAAAEQVEQVRAQAEQEVAAARAEAEGQVKQARAEADRLVAEARDLARAEVARVRVESREQAEQLRQACEQQLADHTAAAQRELQRLGAALESERARGQRLEGDLDQVRSEYDRVLGNASAKSRLIAAYEQLGRSGDPRYGDRDRVGEVARELFEKAGLRSDGTARAYLGEYLAQRESQREGALT
jgi:hypothetical protein